MRGPDLPGMGDEATWPPCTNHPNDPRTNIPDEPWKVFVCDCCGEEIELFETCESWRFPTICECGGDMEQEEDE